MTKAGSLFLFMLLHSVNLSHAQAPAAPPLEGDPSCPCLMSSEELPPIKGVDITENLIKQLGYDTNITSYGVGCSAHDRNTPQCTTDGCIGGPNFLPAPVDCDRSYCERSFCWVDPLNCRLLNRRSVFFSQSGRYYSYATCYDMDSFSNQYLLSALRGRTLKVGFNSNSGGWTGAYSSSGEHFKGGLEKWSGPAVQFAREAALVGGFRMQLTEPPEFLREGSMKFFGGSAFSYCVYATALGYLDMCVAQYSVTDQRASSTDWFLLENEPLYLIVQTDQGEESNWQKFLGYIATIFQPFTTGAWILIIFIVIPVLGILFVFHDYGRAGSSYPRIEEVLVSEDHETYQVREHKIPIYKHAIHSIYTTLLSTLQQGYGGTVVSPGSMWHLLGVAFFILTIVAVYTANLAAILTQQAQVTTVKNFEDALSRGYRFCGERTNIAELGLIYGVPDSAFVVDPPDEGGDGQAGFTCPNCQSRIRVFDFLDKQKASSGDTRYCHAALAPLQDLQVLQNLGEHCNKTIIGQPVRTIQSGFPVHERISREMIALLHKIKNDGVYDKELVRSEPESRCSSESEGGEGSALSIVQLMGIWVVTFGFAFIGIVITLSQPFYKKLRKDDEKPIVKKVHRHDQFMSKRRKLERTDSFLEENTEVVDGQRVFTGMLDDKRQALRSFKHSSMYFDRQSPSDDTLTNTMRDALQQRDASRRSLVVTDDTQRPESIRSDSEAALGLRDYDDEDSFDG